MEVYHDAHNTLAPDELKPSFLQLSFQVVQVPTAGTRHADTQTGQQSQDQEHKYLAHSTTTQAMQRVHRYQAVASADLADAQTRKRHSTMPVSKSIEWLSQQSKAASSTKVKSNTCQCTDYDGSDTSEQPHQLSNYIAVGHAVWCTITMIVESTLHCCNVGPINNKCTCPVIIFLEHRKKSCSSVA